MSHKADESFFERKRTWSKRKDQILAYYLTPYLAKVAKRGSPILLVDGFAGPGKFDDGEAGSPLIMCQMAEAAIAKGADISVLCIETEPEIYRRLAGLLGDFDFAEPRLGTFTDHLPAIEQRVRTHTVFLYLDPFTVEGLDWQALDSVFRQIRERGTSIEVLLNFNAPSFVRRALGLLKRDVPELNPEIEDDEQMDAPLSESASAERLDRVVGGGWWRDVVASTQSFPGQVEALTGEVCQRLRGRFKEVGSRSIKAKADHHVPKYYLLFATGHPDGLKLMNDAMAKSKGESVFAMDLFAPGDLEIAILERSDTWIRRGELIMQVIRDAFCTYTATEIRRRIQDLLKSDRLSSRSGKVRINDDEFVRCTRK